MANYVRIYTLAAFILHAALCGASALTPLNDSGNVVWPDADPLVDRRPLNGSLILSLTGSSLRPDASKLEPGRIPYETHLPSSGDPWTLNDGWCRDRPDHYAAADPASKCRRYFRCVGGRKSVYLCPGRTVFNGQRCVQAADFNCAPAPLPTIPPVETTTVEPVESRSEAPRLNDCDGRVDGYYADFDSGCRSYFFCSNGLKVVYVCAGSQLFNGSQCVSGDVYRCPAPSTSDCVSAATGYYADLSSRCRQYYYCRDDHKLITLTCSDERIFNGRKCLEPHLYRCPSGDESEPRRSAVSTTSRYEVGEREGDCQRSNGFFVVRDTQCQQYYFCIGGSRSNLQCAPGQVFNGQVCVPAAQYQCPETQSADPCQEKTDGVYADQANGCRFYFLCQKGARSGNFTCPFGQIFDGRKCTDQRIVSCQASSSGDHLCHGRRSGLYADAESRGCRGYIYCRSNRRWASAQCPTSQRFHWPSSRCVPKHEVYCPSEEAVTASGEAEAESATWSAPHVAV